MHLPEVSTWLVRFCEVWLGDNNSETVSCKGTMSDKNDDHWLCEAGQAPLEFA